MQIKWTKKEPDMEFSGENGIDENGNRYYITANKEVVTVTTPDGKHGMGWTAEEALEIALNR